MAAAPIVRRASLLGMAGVHGGQPRSLELDDAERTQLFDLARAAQPAVARPRRRPAKQRVRPEVQ